MTLDATESADRDLVRRVRAGDEEAYRALFRRYAPNSLALARRVVRQSFLADEIVQEVFLAVWRSPESYDETRGTVRSWLMGMVHHRAVDAVRREEAQRRRAEELSSAEAEPAVDLEERIVEAVDLPQERRAVRAAIEELPEEQRTVIELMYFGGRSQSAIAAELALPLGTVKSRTLLAMRRMRSALAGMER